jgi:uncharacterized OB-fold protein
MSLREALVTRALPLPLPTADTRPFYDAARRGEFRLQRCTRCGRWRHYPRPVCPACLAREHVWERASGRGVVWTWTVVRGPTLPAFEPLVPYAVVDVLLEEDVHFVSNLVDCPLDAIHAGLPVEATFAAVSDEITLVKFRRRTP